MIIIVTTKNRDHSKIMYVIHECSYFFFLNIQNMNYILLNHCWMYDRCYSGRSSLKESFVEGVEEFVSKASQQDFYHNDGG